MWRRSIVLLVLVVCIVSLITAPVAKAAEETACVKGLVAADCDLLVAAVANVGKLTTFELGYELNITYTGAPMGDVSAKIKGTGPVDLTLITNSDARNIFNNLTMATALDISATGQVNAEISNTASHAEMRITDGSVYFYMADGTTRQQWYKIILSKVLQSAADNPDLATLNVVLLPGFLMGEAVKNDNTTGTRKPGPSLDGRATRLYSLNYEGAVLFGSLPRAQRQLFLKQFITGLLTNLPSEQRDKLENNKAFDRAVERVINDAKIVISWLVEPSGKMIRGFGFELHMKIDAAVGRLFARELAAGVTYFDATLLVTYSKLGQKVTVETPRNALDLTDAIQIPEESA